MSKSGETLDALNTTSELLDEAREPSAEAIIAADKIETLDVFTSDRWTERRELTAHARSVIACALDAFAAQAVAAERERNALFCDERGAWAVEKLNASTEDHDEAHWAQYANACDDCAEVIRAGENGKPRHAPA